MPPGRRGKLRFPRRQWRRGQRERVEPPKKGRGSSYGRAEERRRARREAD